MLALYSPDVETKISADSSSYGLGAVLLQKQQDTWRPVAYASRSLSEAESRYAQIEKEALAGTWACEKFTDYILGKRICLETNHKHKPLVSLSGSKHLDSLPPRILRFRLRLSRFPNTPLGNYCTLPTHCPEIQICQLHRKLRVLPEMPIGLQRRLCQRFQHQKSNYLNIKQPRNKTRSVPK